jgi:serine/threonine protein phosphatase PrpC
MSKQNIETSGFTLAKGTQLVGDDYFEVKVLDTITVAVLCDGAGSALRGAEAAKRTTQFLINALKNRPRAWSIEKSIHHFIDNINRVLYLESMEDYEREELVTTLTLIVIEGDRLYGANIGDSRIYLHRKDHLTQLSTDHSMDEEGMESVLTAAIGLSEHVTPYYFENNLQTGDEILLCSDGLYQELDKQTLATGMKLGASFLVKEASRLHHDKLPDDSTAITIKIKELDPRLRLKQSKLTLQKVYKKGETIDGYLLIKALIQNNRTWLVQKRGLQYVLKFAPFEGLEEGKILDHFVKEVWTAKRLKAGFFPKAAVPRNRTHRYYVMRHIEGVTLKEQISKKPLSADDTIELGHFLLKMAQFLIRKDLVHGDIKPENIMITERKGKMVFKMIYFGSITEVYSTTTRAGTPSYLAPERFAQAPISEQTEIYAIGVVLYEALTQQFPYGEIEPFQNPSFERTIKHPALLNPKIPSWLESVMLHALNPESEKRYSHYSEMMHDLKHPERVKPFFDNHSSIIERKPLTICKIGFVVMLILNIYLLTR